MAKRQQNQPEIKDGRLILNGDEISLQALSDLLEETTIDNMVSDLENIFVSLTRIGALIIENDSQVNHESLKFSFPSYSTIYGIQIILEAFKKM